MALDLGELSGRITLDDRGFTRPMQQAERGLNRLESTSRGSLNRMESDFRSAGQGAARGLGQGLDRAAAAAGQAGAEAGEQFVRGADGRLRNARGQFVRAGTQAGKGFSDGAERAIRGSDLGGAGREAGESAGEGLGSGVETEGRGRMKGVGGKLAGMLKGGPWLAAGAVIGGALMTGLAGAMEKQDALAKLNAQVGAFGPQSAALGRVAGSLYRDAYGESMSDVTEAIRAVKQNIGGMATSSEAGLKKVSAVAMNVATIMDEEVGAVSRAVGTMLKNGMAKNAKEAFDILTRGVQTGANKAEDLLDTFTEYSIQFRKLGMNGKTAMGLISQGLKAGARDADTVADALKEFSIRAVDGSDAAAEGYKLLGLNAEKMTSQIAKGGKPAAAGLQTVLDKLRQMKDPVKREAAAVALFGTKAEDLGQALFALDPSTAVQALGKVGGAADKAGKTLHDTASKNLESFKRKAKGALVDFVGGKILPGLMKFGEKAGPIFQQGIGKITEWLDKNQDKVQEWSNKIQQIADTIGQIFNAAITAASGFWNLFGDTILNHISIVIDTVLGILGGLFKTLLGIWNIFAGIFTGDWSRVWTGIKQVFSGAWQAIWSILKGVLRLALNQIKLIWTKLIPGVLKWAWGKLVALVKWGAKKVIQNISWLAKIPSMVGGWFGRMAAKAIQKALGLARWMKSLPGRIKRGLGNLKGLLVDAGKNVIRGLIRGIQTMTGPVGRAISGIVQKIRDHLPFSPAKEGPLSGSGSPEIAGRKIGSMVAAGIRGSRGDVAGAMDGLSAVASAPAFTVRRPGGGSAVRGGDGAQAPARVVIDIRGGDREMRKLIRKWVREDHGGDTQRAFGQTRRPAGRR